MFSKDALRIYVFDLALLTGLLFVTSLGFEFIKPGLISNFFDFQLFLFCCLIFLIIGAVLPGVDYRMPFILRFFYTVWGLLVVGLFVRVGVDQVTSDVSLLVIGGAVTLLVASVTAFLMSKKL